MTDPVYLSDLTPTERVNGWGPYERDRSNGETGATDGRTLTLNGTTYAKGLGVHSFSSLTYSLGGSYSSFQADLGIDDEVGNNGSVIFRVLADGAEIFRSGTLTGASRTQSINLDVTGRQTLQLIVDNADGSFAFDHANWADAKLIENSAEAKPTEASTVYLSDLTPTERVNGWGPYERDRSNGETGATDGRTLTLNGTTYAKGLGVHSFSSLTYSLGGSYSSFQADLGIDDEVGNNGSVIFRVLADGAEIFRSGTLTGASRTQSINLDVTGRQTLQLIVDNADGSFAFDHANWADAKLIAAPTGSAGEVATAPEPTPPPPPTGSGEVAAAPAPTPPPPPTSIDDIPLTWDDPVFSTVVERRSGLVVGRNQRATDVSINAFGTEGSLVVANESAQIERIRVRGSEGVRAGFGEIYLNQMYIEINGSSTHSDAIQMYGPRSTGRTTLTNSYFRLNPPSTSPFVHLGNAAYWSANDWRGAHVLENVLLAGGSYSLKIPGDGGSSISLKDVFFLEGSSAYGPVFLPEVNGQRPAIVRWENVRYARIENGQIVLGREIPQPYGIKRNYTDAITGTSAQDVFSLATTGDTYIGKNGNDTFRLTSLNQSLFSDYDFITDFSIGLDIIDGPNSQPITPTIISSQPTALTSTAIGNLLNSSGSFMANGAAVFSHGGMNGKRTFLALNDGVAGYSETEDAIIEITGYSGNISQLQVF